MINLDDCFVGQYIRVTYDDYREDDYLQVINTIGSIDKLICKKIIKRGTFSYDSEVYVIDRNYHNTSSISLEFLHIDETQLKLIIA